MDQPAQTPSSVPSGQRKLFIIILSLSLFVLLVAVFYTNSQQLSQDEQVVTPAENIVESSKQAEIADLNLVVSSSCTQEGVPYVDLIRNSQQAAEKGTAIYSENENFENATSLPFEAGEEMIKIDFEGLTESKTYFFRVNYENFNVQSQEASFRVDPCE